MSEIGKLKKELLQGAIRENVELLDDRAYRERRFRRPGWRWPARALTAAAAGVVVFLTMNAISTGGAERPEVLVMTPRTAAESPPAGPHQAPRAIAPALFRLEVGKVILDPGHGGVDPGASSATGLAEKEVTLDVARRLRTLLEEARVKVAMTRSDDRAVALRERSSLANAERGDLFVSIHVNSIPQKEARAVETYYLGAADGPRIAELARIENEGSGYALSDFKKLLEGVYAGVRVDESRRLAGEVQKSLYAGLHEGNGGLLDRGVKSAPLAVLIGTEMPGILVEVSCVSNEDEARLLARGDYRQRIAASIFQGLRSYMDTREPAPRTAGRKTEKGS
jgi:N-acetylmuramoyl-L-alanine amidase